MWLLFWILCGACAVAIARARGRRTLGWGLLGFLLGPIGVVLAYMMPVDTSAIELDQLASGEGRRCPRCAEVVRADAQVCRFCGAEPLGRRPRRLGEAAPQDQTPRSGLQCPGGGVLLRAPQGWRGAPGPAS
jgi:hypothetical protein